MKMGDIKNIMKAILIKNWMADNKFIPEMSDFLTLDNTGKPKFDILEEYLTYTESVTGTLVPFLKKMQKLKENTDTKISNIENNDNESSEPEEETFEEDEETTNNETGKETDNTEVVEEDPTTDDGVGELIDDLK
jgi:hypothetical protein